MDSEFWTRGSCFGTQNTQRDSSKRFGKSIAALQNRTPHIEARDRGKSKLHLIYEKGNIPSLEAEMKKIFKIA